MQPTPTPAPAAPPFTDVMIDLEGLNDTPDSAPVQIGLVLFHLADPASTLLCHSWDVCPISSLRLGLSVSGSTLLWWHDKGKKIPWETGIPLPQALAEMAHLLARHATSDARVWSRGNTYDLAILKLAYHRISHPLPWRFWRERDVRTHLDALGSTRRTPAPHDALQDAENQVLDLLAATHRLPHLTLA